MAEQRVNITQTGSQLIIDSSPAVKDGDWVLWQFPEMLDNQFGFVFFQNRFGPFHSLRSLGNTVVVGKGNVGSVPPDSASYDYTAMILQTEVADPIATGAGTITNQATREDTSPEVLVAYNPDLPPSQAITVTPDPVSLNPGDTATWYFSNLPDGAFANFLFKLDGMPSSRNGPFVNFYAVGGSGPVTLRASGTGFAVAPLGEIQAWPAKIIYYFEIRNQDGVLIGSHEPVIDNLGVPPTSPES
ncbi:MAG TPA: hypothetical protein VF173_33790 [Thermoanaerobaculia bacterium]|nr:hypothetical protein [Thermoanaerobaculia bacterium]